MIITHLASHTVKNVHAQHACMYACTHMYVQCHTNIHTVLVLKARHICGFAFCLAGIGLSNKAVSLGFVEDNNVFMQVHTHTYY